MKSFNDLTPEEVKVLQGNLPIVIFNTVKNLKAGSCSLDLAIHHAIAPDYGYLKAYDSIKKNVDHAKLSILAAKKITWEHITNMMIDPIAADLYMTALSKNPLDKSQDGKGNHLSIVDFLMETARKELLQRYPNNPAMQRLSGILPSTDTVEIYSTDKIRAVQLIKKEYDIGLKEAKDIADTIVMMSVVISTLKKGLELWIRNGLNTPSGQTMVDYADKIIKTTVNEIHTTVIVEKDIATEYPVEEDLALEYPVIDLGEEPIEVVLVNPTIEEHPEVAAGRPFWLKEGYERIETFDKDMKFDKYMYGYICNQIAIKVCEVYPDFDFDDVVVDIKVNILNFNNYLYNSKHLCRIYPGDELFINVRENEFVVNGKSHPYPPAC